MSYVWDLFRHAAKAVRDHWVAAGLTVGGLLTTVLTLGEKLLGMIKTWRETWESGKKYNAEQAALPKPLIEPRSERFYVFSVLEENVGVVVIPFRNEAHRLKHSARHCRANLSFVKASGEVVDIDRGVWLNADDCQEDLEPAETAYLIVALHGIWYKVMAPSFEAHPTSPLGEAITDTLTNNTGKNHDVNLHALDEGEWRLTVTLTAENFQRSYRYLITVPANAAAGPIVKAEI